MAKGDSTISMKGSNTRIKRLQEIEAKINLVSDLEFLLNSLVWGRVKSGKTAFIATGPRPVIFAVEEGTKTIRDYPNLTVFPTYRTPDGKIRWRTPRWKDARDFIYYLNYGDHSYETVGVDTMTALLRVAVRFITKDEEIRDDLRAKGLNDQRTWGRVGNIMNEFMEDLESVCKARGMHLVYTAQERALGEEQVWKTGSEFVPDLTPSVRSTILEKPDMIMRTIKEEEQGEDLNQTTIKYGMVFKHAEWPVGVREPRSAKPFPAKAYDVTIPKILKRMNSNKGE